MSSPAIKAVLQQMQSVASQAAGQAKGGQISATVGAGGFAEAFQNSLTKINQLQQAATERKQAFEAGEPNVSLNDVMIESQKASLAFQMATQVRNRLVQAYNDIMNMQV